MNLHIADLPHGSTGCVPQDIRLAAERSSGEHNYLWTPDASQDAEDAPQRAAFVM